MLQNDNTLKTKQNRILYRISWRACIKDRICMGFLLSLVACSTMLDSPLVLWQLFGLSNVCHPNHGDLTCRQEVTFIVLTLHIVVIMVCNVIEWVCLDMRWNGLVRLEDWHKAKKYYNLNKILYQVYGAISQAWLVTCWLWTGNTVLAGWCEEAG